MRRRWMMSSRREISRLRSDPMNCAFGSSGGCVFPWTVGIVGCIYPQLIRPAGVALEASYKTRDWDLLRRTLSTQVCWRLRMTYISRSRETARSESSVPGGSFADIEPVHRAIKLALKMAESPAGVWPRAWPLLHQFQLLVELIESTQLVDMVDILSSISTSPVCG